MASFRLPHLPACLPAAALQNDSRLSIAIAIARLRLRLCRRHALIVGLQVGCFGDGDDISMVGETHVGVNEEGLPDGLPGGLCRGADGGVGGC